MTTATSEPQIPTIIGDFRAAIANARADLTNVLEVACGDSLRRARVRTSAASTRRR